MAELPKGEKFYTYAGRLNGLSWLGKPIHRMVRSFSYNSTTKKDMEGEPILHVMEPSLSIFGYALGYHTVAWRSMTYIPGEGRDRGRDLYSVDEVTDEILAYNAKILADERAAAVQYAKEQQESERQKKEAKRSFEGFYTLEDDK